VVEASASPRQRGMARTAFPTEQTLMHIVVAVAVAAGRRCHPEGLAGLMTSGTWQTSMCALEWKVRVLVIERSRIELGDIGVAPHVFTVAGHALPRGYIRKPPVKSPRFPNVLGDVLVAVQAQNPLPLPIRPVVTGGARGLVLRVCGRNLSGHEQRFQLGRPSFSRH
jgi:hypothetical protein